MKSTMKLTSHYLNDLLLVLHCMLRPVQLDNSFLGMNTKVQSTNPYKISIAQEYLLDCTFTTTRL